MNRRRKILGLVGLFTLFLVVNIVYAVYYGPGVVYQSSITGGYLTFTTGFNASGITWASDLIIFSGFNMTSLGYFGDLGFEIPSGVNMTVSKVDPYTIIFFADRISTDTIRVYFPSKNAPSSVLGVDLWAYVVSTHTVDMIIEEDTTVTISWESYYVENDTYSEPQPVSSTSFASLIDQYLIEGDLSGLIISQYTMSMGSMFFVLVLLGLSVPIYQRVGTIPTIILWILFWGTFNIVLPPGGINLAVSILALSIASLFVVLYLSRRSQYI